MDAHSYEWQGNKRRVEQLDRQGHVLTSRIEHLERRCIQLDGKIADQAWRIDVLIHELQKKDQEARFT